MRKRIIQSALCVFALCSTASADLVNGGFETGDFTGWTVAGFTGTVPFDLLGNNHNYQTYIAGQNAGTPKTPTDSVITSQTSAFVGGALGPAINPTAGAYLAFLSNETSAGDQSLTGSSITQSFVVGVGATSLTFDIRFLTNEEAPNPNLPNGTAYDFGGLALLQGNTVLHQFNLDELLSSPANAHATQTAAGGFSASTPWLSGSFDLSGLGGQSVTLVGYVTNTPDMVTESRLLLDNIQVVATTKVPEASGLGVLVVAAALFGVLRKKLAC